MVDEKERKVRLRNNPEQPRLPPQGPRGKLKSAEERLLLVLIVEPDSAGVIDCELCTLRPIRASY